MFLKVTFCHEMGKSYPRKPKDNWRLLWLKNDNKRVAVIAYILLFFSHNKIMKLNHKFCLGMAIYFKLRDVCGKSGRLEKQRWQFLWVFSRLEWRIYCICCPVFRNVPSSYKHYAIHHRWSISAESATAALPQPSIDHCLRHLRVVLVHLVTFSPQLLKLYSFQNVLFNWV